MKQLTFLFLFCILFFSASAAGDDWRSKVATTVLEEAEAGDMTEYLVVLWEQADVENANLFRSKEDKGRYVYEQLSATAAQTQSEVLRTIRRAKAMHQSYWIVNAVWVKSGLELLESLARLPEVKRIDPNPRIYFDGPVDGPPPASPRGLSSIEWGVSKIGADQAWASGYTGQGVVIGGQDTGVEWDHLAIKDQYRGWNGTTADHNYNWHDAIHAARSGNPCGSNTVTPCDDNNHGTHTVGTMVGDDSGSNQIGVAPGARWIACRNMDRGYGTPTTYIECFQWFLAPTNSNGNNPDATKAPHVINNSWGCPTSEGCNSGNFATMEAVVNSLKTAGIVVVVSAGNSGSGCNTVNTPAAIYENSFSVGATNSSDNIAGFSSRGPVTVDGSGRAKPNVSAPGVAVRSCIRNGRYASFQGTSMAGPHVAGAVALIISADPGLAGQVEVIESALETTSVGRTTTQNCGGVSGSSIPNNTYGYGRIDALAAINSLLPLPVDLTSFYAVPEKKYVRVHWQTSAELNSDHFVLEKSLDLNHWSAIGTVEARSNSQVQVDYSFDDLHPQAGSNYYRLRQVDRDGSHEYSKVVTAVYEDAGKNVRIFPNPIREEVKLRFAETWTGGQLSVFNALGQLVHQQPLARQPKGSDFVVDASTWSEGMYFLNLQDANGQLVKQEKLLKH